MTDCVRHGGAEGKGPSLRRLQANLGETSADSVDLLGNCLAFCSGLTTHQVGEDDGMFAELLRARPDLEPVITNLVQDHQMIAAIIGRRAQASIPRTLVRDRAPLHRAEEPVHPSNEI